MHFHFDPREHDEEFLLFVWEQAVKDCVQRHCTCDAGVLVLPTGTLVATEKAIEEVLIMRTIHTKYCYAAGRNN
jgi:hypothetical protein